MDVHDFRALLKEAGWQFLRQSGSSHEIWTKKYPDGHWRNERWAPGGNTDKREVTGGLLKDLIRRFELQEVMAESKQPKPIDFRARFMGGTKIAPEGTFGRRLYESRKAAGFSQGSLAKALYEGVTPKLAPTYQALQTRFSIWERGDADPFDIESGQLTNRSKGSAPLIGELAELFGWKDLMHYKTVKSARGQLVAAEVEPEHFEVTVVENGEAETVGKFTMVGDEVTAIESIPVSRVLQDEAAEEARVKELAPKRSSEQKAFARLLETSDVMQWMIDRDNEIRRLTKEINDLKRAEGASDELRAKARKWDEVQRLLSK